MSYACWENVTLQEPEQAPVGQCSMFSKFYPLLSYYFYEESWFALIFFFLL